MINLYILKDGIVTLKPDQTELTDHCGEILWIDLLDINLQEEALVEKFLGIDIPTREEMNEIEISHRLYHENGAVYMTSIIVTDSQNNRFLRESHAVTFILFKQYFITVRYTHFKALNMFHLSMQKDRSLFNTAQNIFLGLMDSIVAVIADKLEQTTKELDICSCEIFARDKKEGIREQQDYQKVFQNIGSNGMLVSKLRESLVTIERMIAYAMQTRYCDFEEYQQKQLEIIAKDVKALSGYASFLTTEISFLLDAIIGVIGIEQNSIIKIFSVATVVLMPPTLIASIYGMNFEFMPELNFKYGYPLTIATMIFTSWLFYRFFKKKNWL